MPGNKFTPDQVAFLKSNYTTAPWQVLEEKCAPHTHNQILDKAKRLGLQRAKNTPEQVRQNKAARRNRTRLKEYGSLTEGCRHCPAHFGTVLGRMQHERKTHGRAPEASAPPAVHALRERAVRGGKMDSARLCKMLAGLF